MFELMLFFTFLTCLSLLFFIFLTSTFFNLTRFFGRRGLLFGPAYLPTIFNMYNFENGSNMSCRYKRKSKTLVYREHKALPPGENTFAQFMSAVRKRHMSNRSFRDLIAFMKCYRLV